jgi:hypothetical protein
MFQFILLLIVLYFIVKIANSLFLTPQNKPEVHGASRTDSLDLSKKDIEDIDYKETPEDKR